MLLQFTKSLGASSLIPLMSFFIVEGLGSAPWQVGLYTGLVMPLTLIANRWAGERLDHGFRVKRLLLISICAFILLTALLTQVSNLLMLVLLVAPLMGLANMGSGTDFYLWAPLRRTQWPGCCQDQLVAAHDGLSGLDDRSSGIFYPGCAVWIFRYVLLCISRRRCVSGACMGVNSGQFQIERQTESQRERRIR